MLDSLFPTLTYPLCLQDFAHAGKIVDAGIER